MPQESNNALVSWQSRDGCECAACVASRLNGGMVDPALIPNGALPPLTAPTPASPYRAPTPRRSSFTPAAPVTSVVLTAPTPAPAERPGRTFGVEVETEWDEDSPANAEYHSHGDGADYPYPNRWAAQRDGSLNNGCEFVSPVLGGVAGALEAGLVMQLAESEGANISDRCGAHIHIGKKPDDQGFKVQMMTIALEEALFATTGAYRRYRDNDYTRRIKQNESVAESIIQFHSEQSDRYMVCNVRGRTYEFRHPPGTLYFPQFLINLGLVQLLTDTSQVLEDGELAEIVNKAMEAHRNGDLHKSILFGLEQIKRFGDWKAGGEWRGLPYQPGDSSYRYGAELRGSHYQISLPSEETLLKRLERQLTNFYRRMNQDRNHPRNRGLEEALAVFAIDPVLVSQAAD